MFCVAWIIVLMLGVFVWCVAVPFVLLSAAIFYIITGSADKPFDLADCFMDKIFKIFLKFFSRFV